MCKRGRSEPHYTQLENGTKHSDHIIAQWQKGQFCDLSIRVGCQTFNVHRVVVSASEFFRMCMQTGMREEQSGCVVVQDARSDLVELALRYMYTGTAQVQAADLLDMLELSCRLLYTPLIDDVTTHIIDTFAADSVFCCWRAAGRLGLPCMKILAHAARVWCANNFGCVAERIARDASFDEISEILSLEAIFCDQGVVLATVLKWLGHHCSKKQQARHLLQHIRFADVPPTDLLLAVRADGTGDVHLDAESGNSDIVIRSLLKKKGRRTSSPLGETAQIEFAWKIRDFSKVLRLEAGKLLGSPTFMAGGLRWQLRAHMETRVGMYLACLSHDAEDVAVDKFTITLGCPPAYFSQRSVSTFVFTRRSLVKMHATPWELGDYGWSNFVSDADELARLLCDDGSLQVSVRIEYCDAASDA